MKKNQLIYWITTGIFCTFLLLTGVAYFTDPKFVGIFSHLGFPQYFRQELGAAKVIGALLLLIPQVPGRLKEWVYVGFGITLISGAIAHLHSGDPAGYIINVIFFFGLLVLSYIYRYKRSLAQVNSVV